MGSYLHWVYSNSLEEAFDDLSNIARKIHQLNQQIALHEIKIERLFVWLTTNSSYRKSVHGEFPTIFDGRINIHRYHTLRDVLYKEEYLLPLANYYFSKEHFDKAAEVYSEIIGLAKGKADLFEKLGFCLRWSLIVH